MRTLLRAEYLNGHFGDPALYVWEIQGRDALLIDCGDLSRLSTRQLYKVNQIFISHCHIDHFFGFDLFLRVHMGMDKTVTVFGPVETSERVGGKLQGYTWNLVYDQNLEFVAVDLDPVRGKKHTTRFHAKNRFRPLERTTEEWDPKDPVFDTGTYHVHTAMLDHRTSSLAYAIEEKLTVSVNPDALEELQVKTGPWINELKRLYLFGGLESGVLDIPLKSGQVQAMSAQQLAAKILIPCQRHKIAYATDGAAHEENRKKLLRLIRGADLFFSETCFLQEDIELADKTKHFTAAFIGKLAREAQVKSLIPFHFSKRYLECPEKVLDEVRKYFGKEVQTLT